MDPYQPHLYPAISVGECSIPAGRPSPLLSRPHHLQDKDYSSQYVNTSYLEHAGQADQRPSAPPLQEISPKPKERRQRSSTLPLHESSFATTSSPISRSRSQRDLQATSKKMNVASPSGYNIMDSFANGNIIFIVPEDSPKRLPITVSTVWKTVHGGGDFNDDSRFQVIIPRKHPSQYLIALRCLKGKERYLCIDKRGKIKIRDGYKDSCDLLVNIVGDAYSHIVCFESAESCGLFLGVKASSNNTVDAGSITADSVESHFTIMIDERTSESLSCSPKLRVFETNSVMNRIQDRSVVRLFSHDQRYLAIDKKGRVKQTHNIENHDCWFRLFDRGMGVVSLRSEMYPEYWLRLQDGELMGKGLGADAMFNVKETPDHLVCFELLLQPEIYVTPPFGNPAYTASSEFTLEVVEK